MSETKFLNDERSLPGAGKGNVVQWQIFRSKQEANAHIRSVRLGIGQHLVGGYSRDSIGPFWWVGVRVDDMERWGNRQAINKHGGV